MPKKLKDRIEGILYRRATFKAKGIINEEERLVEVSFSSEARVLRKSFFEGAWIEVLSHKRGAVDLSRLRSGAPVRYNHSGLREDRLGVVEDARVDSQKKRGVATVRFSKDSSVDREWKDVVDGVLRNISAGYIIDERKLTREGEGDRPPEYLVTRWIPAEISFVDVPADATVGVGRDGDDLGLVCRNAPGVPADGEYYQIVNLETITKERTVNRQQLEEALALARRNLTSAIGTDDEESARQEVMGAERALNAFVDPVPAVAAVATPAAAPASSGAPAPEDNSGAVAEGVQLEATRRQEVGEVFSRFLEQDGVGEIQTRCLNDTGVTVDAARSQLLAHIGANASAAGGDPFIEMGDTEDVKWRNGFNQLLQVRAGLLAPAEMENVEHSVRGYTLYEIARKMLELRGIDTRNFGKMELVGRSFTTSDFPLILQDNAVVAMKKGFEEASETWAPWTNVGNLSDFKTAHRVNLSSFDDLTLVREGGEYKYGTFVEEEETITLATYGKLFAISRQAIINDDLQAFTRIPQKMGRAAARVPGDLAYAILTANGNMSDGVALFHDGSHSNDTASTGVPTAVRVGTGRTKMGLQTDQSTNANGLNIEPAYMLVPLELRDTANVLMSSEHDPAASVAGIPNPVRGIMSVIADPRLSSDSATAWYMVADPNLHDTVEVAFLDGVQAPTLEQQQGWSIDGTEFKIRLDCASAAMEWRTMQRNTG